MSLRVVVVVALSLSVLAAGAAEIPLSPAQLGPSPGVKNVVASIATPDGFLTVRMEGPFLSERLVAARISNDGQVLEPRGIVIGSLDRSIYQRTYDLRADGGRYVLTVITPFLAKYPSTYEYQQKRITLDADARVVADETAILTKEPQNWPANHYGETLRVGTRPEYSTLTILFVGRNGTPRNPTPLPEMDWVLSIEPYEDEWLIVGTDVNSRLRWCRIKESTRDAPRRRSIEAFTGSYDRTIVHADGHFGVLVARTNFTPPQYRNLTLHVITPEGAIRQYSLLTNELVKQSPYTPTPKGTVAKEGDSWIVAYRWLDFDQRAEMRMWRIGSKIESSVIDGGFAPVLLSGPTRNLLLVRRERPASRLGWDDLYASVFDRGTFLSPSHPSSLLSWSHPLQTHPAAAGGAHGVFSAWVENDGDVVARFIGADGTSTAPVAISSPAWEAQAPAVARNGDTFIVGWQEWLRTPSAMNQKVLVARFDGHGNPIDAEPLLIERLPVATPIGMSIAAEGDGFRLAWTGRLLPDAFGRDGEQAVFTIHLGARAETAPEPEPLLTPGDKTPASRPIVVSNGNDAIVLWTQAGEVAERHYAGGVEVKNFASLVGLDSVTVAAAANDDEVLLATVTSSADGQTHCTWAQRLSFSGVKLAHAQPLECTPAFPARTSVVWDRNRWWVSSSESLSHVHELRADGTVAGLPKIFPSKTTPQLMHLFASAEGTSAVYVRIDAETDFIERAFLRTFPRPKARSVRP